MMPRGSLLELLHFKRNRTICEFDIQFVKVVLLQRTVLSLLLFPFRMLRQNEIRNSVLSINAIYYNKTHLRVINVVFYKSYFTGRYIILQ